MARPKKCRRICREPSYDGFIPKGISTGETVELTFDEYEVLRLVDLEKKTHEQCAMQMGVARTTITEMVEAARYKVTDCLVNGKSLCINGGNYQLCDGSIRRYCGQGCCRGEQREIPKITEKGAYEMRIAVTYENGNIFQHFGHTEYFKVYDAEGTEIKNSQVIPTLGNGHGALAGFLAENQVNVLICGGIGGGAKNALASVGIRLYGGVSGSADEAVAALLAGTLGYNPDVRCSHHDHEHGQGDQSCGDHKCGSHDCH
ncbi:MAG: DUF134 domain-containing protein [Clostridiales bacterium]|nr:DUF134 domain-containing protein [Clostridiales bacterium]